MQKIMVEIDDETMQRLEAIAPARSRRRSEFVRMAIRRAIWEIEEQQVAEAYGRQPDSGTDAYLDARAWESPAAVRERGADR